MLSSVTTNRAGISATFQYHPSSLVKTITHGNTTTTTIGADARLRVASIEVKNTGGSLWKTGTYRYDGGGNIYEIGESTFPAMDYWKFGYDAQQRLARAQMAGYTISHAYDIYGNMSTQHFIAGTALPGMEFQNRSYSQTGLPSQNRIVAPGFGYDVNGNLVAEVSGTNYAYDLRNRLNAVGPLNTSGQIVPKGVYQYSASSLRVSRDDRISGTMTFYFRGLAGEVLSEFTRPSSGGTAVWTRDYVSGGGRQLAVIENKGTSGIVSSTLHPDHLGSIRLVTNASGQMISKHAYFPFGKEIPPLIASPSTHRYLGREWDSESDLLYLMTRQFSGAQTRFLTPDSSGIVDWDPQSWNRYAYAGNSPVTFSDPDGRAKWLVHYEMAKRAGFSEDFAKAVANADKVGGFDWAPKWDPLFRPWGHFSSARLAVAWWARAARLEQRGRPEAAKKLRARGVHLIHDRVWHTTLSGRHIGPIEHFFRIILDIIVPGPPRFNPDRENRPDRMELEEKSVEQSQALKEGRLQIDEPPARFLGASHRGPVIGIELSMLK